ncbi:MAG: hypothetical protein ISS66_08065 [Desulfobacteraceae bacterium]|nr:hypothetical protein [Desulfobacteraceae bacterium]
MSTGQDDVVIRLSFGATSRRSTTGVCAFIHGQARGLLRRRINKGINVHKNIDAFTRMGFTSMGLRFEYSNY